MIRLIVRNVDNSSVAAGVDDIGAVTHKSFDMELPELEEFLTKIPGYHCRAFIGIEIIPANTDLSKHVHMYKRAVSIGHPSAYGGQVYMLKCDCGYTTEELVKE